MLLINIKQNNQVSNLKITYHNISDDVVATKHSIIYVH